MTWDVIQDESGAYALVEHGAPVPEGWKVVAETANPDYLDLLSVPPSDGAQDPDGAGV